MIRRALNTAALVLLGVACAVAAIWFFAARDVPTTSAPAPAETPGRPAGVPGTLHKVAVGTLSTGKAAAHDPYAYELRRGNVILFVDRRELPMARTLAENLAGPPSRGRRADGQAIIVQARHVPAGHPAVTAYAQGRALDASTVADPRLRAFIDYWLGRAAG